MSISSTAAAILLPAILLLATPSKAQQAGDEVWAVGYCSSKTHINKLADAAERSIEEAYVLMGQYTRNRLCSRNDVRVALRKKFRTFTSADGYVVDIWSALLDGKRVYIVLPSMVPVS